MVINQPTPGEELVLADCWPRLLLSLCSTSADAVVVCSNGAVALPGFSFILTGYKEKYYKDTL